MGKGSTKNQKKIEELRALMAEKKTLREIINIKFGESEHRLEDWLDKFHSKLTQEELKYLGYTIKPEVVEDTEVQKDIPSKVPALAGEPNYISIKIREMDDLQRENFLKSDIVLQKIFDLVNGKIASEEIKDTNLIVPADLRHLPDTMIKNIRVSDRFYKRFVQLAKESGVSVVDATNLMFKEFLAKYEK